MRFIYYAGFLAGAFMVFRFEGLLEFIGATFISIFCIAETARAMSKNKENK